MRDYKTVSGEAVSEFIEKKSRFISYIAPVSSEEEASAFLSKISQMHREARHIVYAYSLLEGQTKRFSDAGEPSGTAGMPTLEVILHKELYNVAIATVRYFGGILLGTGGLTRAYSKGASDAVASADIITRTWSDKFTITMNYSLYGKILPYLNSKNLVIQDSEFGENITLTIISPIAETEALERELIDMTSANIIFSQKQQLFFDF
jgi:uncharacterized YigZ family protein